MWLFAVMDILLVSATSAEIAPLIEYISQKWQRQSEEVFVNGDSRLQVLITGVGMMQTAYALTRLVRHHRFDFALQAGIAGSFNRQIPLSEVVQVTKEMLGDLGAEDHYNFHDVFDLGLANPNTAPFSNKQLIAPQHPFIESLSLQKVSSLSINSVSGSSFTSTARYDRYHCDLESMEGAAFFFVCLNENLSFAQIRAISNYVEARDRSKWKIKEAVMALNQKLIRLLETSVASS